MQKLVICVTQALLEHMSSFQWLNLSKIILLHECHQNQPELIQHEHMGKGLKQLWNFL